MKARFAGGISSGMHESQSRLWENLVGRSRGFWECFYPQLQGVFLRQLGQVPTDAFYRAINKVSRSLVRTDADEVTYNLYVAIRFDLELAMLEGKRSSPRPPRRLERDAIKLTSALSPPPTAKALCRCPLVCRYDRRNVPRLHPRRLDGRPILRNRRRKSILKFL